jgi:hypothetical protein
MVAGIPQTFVGVVIEQARNFDREEYQVIPGETTVRKVLYEADRGHGINYEVRFTYGGTKRVSRYNIP